MSDSKATEAPEQWIEIVRESDAALASGATVSLSTIRAELRATIEEIEAALASQSDRPVDEN